MGMGAVMYALRYILVKIESCKGAIVDVHVYVGVTLISSFLANCCLLHSAS